MPSVMTYGFFLMAFQTNAGSKFCATTKNYEAEEKIRDNITVNPNVNKQDDVIEDEEITNTKCDEMQGKQTEETLQQELIDENQNNKNKEDDPSLLLDIENTSVDLLPAPPRSSLITDNIEHVNISTEVQASELAKELDEVAFEKKFEELQKAWEETKKCLIASEEKVKHLQAQILKINENPSSEDDKKPESTQDGLDDSNNIPKDTESDATQTEKVQFEEKYDGDFVKWKNITIGLGCAFGVGLQIVLCYTFRKNAMFRTNVTQNEGKYPQQNEISTSTYVQHQHFSRSESYSPDPPILRVKDLESYIDSTELKQQIPDASSICTENLKLSS